MSEVLLKFEREDREGLVAVGTYLIDAAKRFGIHLEDSGNAEEGFKYSSVVVEKGAEHLSPLTQIETEHFTTRSRRKNERLASQARIDSSGEVVIMTDENKQETAEDSNINDQNEKYKKEFTDLPLEKKLSTLVQLEAIALGETFSFIINSPYMIFDKVMDVMAEFGLKKETDAKNASRPKEHKAPQPTSKTGPKSRKATAKPETGD
ncbi:MAG: hypothetical protein H7070_10930 [Saprospiraceae bacterium]|nr:hypothetical protein [Pyrinomonadaceae bacterium]